MNTDGIDSPAPDITTEGTTSPAPEINDEGTTSNLEQSSVYLMSGVSVLVVLTVVVIVLIIKKRRRSPSPPAVEDLFTIQQRSEGTRTARMVQV